MKLSLDLRAVILLLAIAIVAFAVADTLFEWSGVGQSGILNYTWLKLTGATLTGTTTNSGTITGGAISGVTLSGSLTNAVLLGTTSNAGAVVSGTLAPSGVNASGLPTSTNGVTAWFLYIDTGDSYRVKAVAPVE